MKSLPVFITITFLSSAIALSQEVGGGPFQSPGFGGHDPGPQVLVLRGGAGSHSGFLPDPQDPPQSRGGQMQPGNQQIRRQLEQIKIWQMTKEMSLPTEKAEKFFPLYNEYNEQMRSITDERRKSIRTLDSAVDSRAADAEISNQIKHVLTLDDQLAETHVKFIKSLGDILSPLEVAKYMVFEQRFDREIRERIRRMMMERRMGGPGR